MTETGSIPPFTVKIYKFQWTTNRHEGEESQEAREMVMQTMLMSEVMR